MKWTQATGLLATVGLIAAGGVWAGCGNGGGGDDGGTDSGGNDVNQPDTSKNDSGPTDSGGNSPSDAGPGVDANALDCNYYCDTIIATCTGGNNQYLNKATCMLMCTDGIPNDAGAGATSGNSLACRMYHVSVAATSTSNAATHCPHAGPYGYGVCGDICTDFCHQYYTSACKSGTGWTSEVNCDTVCPTQAGADASAGAPGNAATTPTMLCKEYHLENAVANDGGGGHCDHSSLGGGGQCN